MTSSLVGSEMCIRDSNFQWHKYNQSFLRDGTKGIVDVMGNDDILRINGCLLYTSDAADDM
eukprot:9561268-Prorocentrum_lima.AAC.1